MKRVTKKTAAAEVDRLLNELLPAPPMTEAVLAAKIVDALGHLAVGLTIVIESSETPEQALDTLLGLELRRQLYLLTQAVGSAEAARALKRAGLSSS
jgi:hypothetical protein